MPSRCDSLSALFLPAGVVVFTMSDRGPLPDLMPGETKTLKRAIAKRRAEFARGRACARAALGELGIPPAPILVGPTRAPIWPEGVKGSITHCCGLVAAAVCDEPAIEAIGLDAEPREALGADIARRIAAPEELEALGSISDLPENERPRLVFSAKEVVHKCIHPLTGVALGFMDVAIEFDHRAFEFSVRARSERARALSQLGRLRGRYRADEGHMVTAGAVIAEP